MTTTIEATGNYYSILSDLTALLLELQSEIGDEYRAPDDDGDEPSMQVTIGVNANGSAWGWQSGDNSYTGGAYSFPHWGVATLYRDLDEQQIAGIARGMLDEAFEPVFDACRDA